MYSSSEVQFYSSVIPMGVDWSMIKSKFNNFCAVVYKLNLAKENLSNQEKKQGAAGWRTDSSPFRYLSSTKHHSWPRGRPGQVNFSLKKL